MSSTPPRLYVLLAFPKPTRLHSLPSDVQSAASNDSTKNCLLFDFGLKEATEPTAREPQDSCGVPGLLSPSQQWKILSNCTSSCSFDNSPGDSPLFEEHGKKQPVS